TDEPAARPVVHPALRAAGYCGTIYRRWSWGPCSSGDPALFAHRHYRPGAKDNENGRQSRPGYSDRLIQDGRVTGAPGLLGALIRPGEPDPEAVAAAVNWPRRPAASAS